MDSYLGEIRIFAGDYAPEYWHICDGTTLNISDYSPLFALIGTTYGGNGSTNFALPDLRSRLPIAQGQGAGLTQRSIGSKGGAEAVTILQANIPLHTHSITVSKVESGNVTNPTSLSYIGTVQVPGTTGFGYIATNASGITKKVMDDSAILPFSGGGFPHSNIMPVVSCNYIICLNGIFPQQQQ